MSTLTVAIAGITGKFARKLVKNLLVKPNIQIHGTTRNASKLPEDLSNNSRIKIFETGADDVTKLREAVKGADVVVCCYLGWHDVMLDGQKTLIDASIAEGVSRYVAGDWSGDFRKLQYGDHVGKDDMKHIAEYLDERADKIKAVHILNGGFLEVMFTGFFGLLNTKEDQVTVYEGGKNKFQFTTYADAAAVTAEVIADKDASGWIEVAGDSLNPQEIAKVYGEVYGVETKVVDNGSFADAKEKLTQIQKAEPRNPFAWMGLNYQIICFNNTFNLDNADNSRFPSVKFTTVRDYFQNTKKEALATGAQ